MKAKRILPLLAAAALLAGCFKDVSYKTNYVLKPLAQAQTVDPVEPFEGLKAYAFDADTAFYTVASYEDALNGVIARKDDLSDRIASPVAAAEPCVREGTVGWVQMPLSAETQMVVAVDPVNRVYAYTQQELDVNLPNLYVSLIFKPWKGFSYKEGNWSFYNEFYAPPVYLDCLIDPSVQLAEGGETSEIANVKAYAYAADTTAFYIASYDDGRVGQAHGENRRRHPARHAVLGLRGQGDRALQDGGQLLDPDGGRGRPHQPPLRLLETGGRPRRRDRDPAGGLPSVACDVDLRRGRLALRRCVARA